MCLLLYNKIGDNNVLFNAKHKHPQNLIDTPISSGTIIIKFIKINAPEYNDIE